MLAPWCEECGQRAEWEACSSAKYHFIYGSREALDLEAFERTYGAAAEVWLCFGCGDWGAFTFIEAPEDHRPR